MDDGFAMGYALGQDSGGNKNNGGMFDGNGSWIWIIVVFALLFGWGNNGNNQGANNGNGGGCAMPAYIPYPVGGAAFQGGLTRADLCSEFNFNGLENGVRGISQGICDSTFALNNTIVNGFNGVGNAICNLGYEQAQLHNATQVALMQGFNAAQAQAADCCCKTQTNIMQLGNQVERGFCQTNFNDQANTTAIIQNAHNDTDRVLAKLDAMEMARKDETIFALREKLSAADLAASQAAQNNYLISQLRPCPQPAYLTCNPFTGQTYAYGGYGNGCSCNSGCGC